MALLTFEATAGDGYVQSVSTTYATAREGGTLTSNAIGSTLNVGQWFSTPNYTEYETFLSFNTNGIPTDLVILDVYLDLYISNDQSTTDFILEARLHDYGTGVSTADYIAGSALSADTLLATLDTSAGSGVGYRRCTADPAFAANINRTGQTRIVLSSSRHRTGTVPPGASPSAEYVSISSSEVSAGAQVAKLILLVEPALSHTLGTNSSKTTGTSLAITTTNAVAAGEASVVALAMDPAAGTVSASDSAGNSYAVQADIANGSGTAGARLVLLAKHNAAALAAGGTITITHPSCAARAVSAASFVFTNPSVEVTSATATGSSTAPTSTAHSPLLNPIIIAAVAVEGPSSDTYTSDPNFTPLPGVGTTGGAAGSNITLNWAWSSPTEQIDHVHAPTLGTSRLWADAVIVLDTTKARIRTFHEKAGYRTAWNPNLDTVDGGIAYDPTTGFATDLWCIVNVATLTVWYAVVIGGVTYGGNMTYGETITPLPANTVGVVIDAAANVDYTGLDYGFDIRVPA